MASTIAEDVTLFTIDGALLIGWRELVVDPFRVIPASPQYVSGSSSKPVSSDEMEEVDDEEVVVVVVVALFLSVAMSGVAIVIFLASPLTIDVVGVGEVAAELLL